MGTRKIAGCIYTYRRTSQLLDPKKSQKKCKNKSGRKKNRIGSLSQEIKNTKRSISINLGKNPVKQVAFEQLLKRQKGGGAKEEKKISMNTLKWQTTSSLNAKQHQKKQVRYSKSEVKWMTTPQILGIKPNVT